MRVYIISCLFACMLCCRLCFAQQNDFNLTLPFTNYTTAQGLINNRCDVVRQDGKGYLWIGTDMGICRYDGRGFRHFPSPGVWPFRSALSATCYKGIVYFGLDDLGIAACYGDSVRFLKAPSGRMKRLGGLVVLNDSTFLLTENTRAATLSQAGVVTILPFNKAGISFLEPHCDSRNNLWWETTTGLYFFAGTHLQQPQRIPFFEGSYIYNLHENAAGGMYVSSRKGLYYYEPSLAGDPLKALPRLVLPAGSSIYTAIFEETGGGMLWLASNTQGIFRLDRKSGRLDSFDTRNGLVSRTLWDIFKDREGNLWFASDDGLSKLSRQDYAAVSLRNAGFAIVKSGIAWDDTTFLFCNGQHIYRHTPSGVALVAGYTNIPLFTEERMLKIDAHTIWIITHEQRSTDNVKSFTCVYHYDGGRLRFLRKLSSLPDAPQIAYPDASIKARNGDFWLGTNAGLVLCKSGKFYPISYPGRAAANLSPSNIAEGPGQDMWMIDGSKVLRHFRVLPAANAGPPYRLAETAHYDSLAPKDYIFNLFRDSRNRLWVGSTSSGLHMAQLDDSGDAKTFTSFAGDAFSSRRITSFSEDAQGNIWVGTASGLDRIRTTTAGFSIEKGLYEAELCGRYIYFAKPVGDQLFVGTTGCLGVITLHAAAASEKAGQPVIISGLLVNNLLRNSLLGAASPTFAPGENNLSFTLTGLSFSDEHAVRYRYMLQGLDAGWSVPTASYTINYPNLPPGHYTFKVLAGTENGAWSASPAMFSFFIAQHFYTTWWFYLLILLLIAAGLYALYRYRLAQILAMQQVRQKISKDLHDDIGATVSSIGIMATMAGRQGLTAEKKEQFLQTISDDTRYVTESLSDIVWSINPRNDTLAAIFARLQRYAAELFEAKDIRYTITLPEGKADERVLSMDARQHLLLIFKEAVNNLAKYSGATEAAVRFTIEGRLLMMQVSDNGKGFDQEAAHEGNGIHNMRKRAAEMKAGLTIKSSDDGTVIKLEVPV